MRPVVEKAPIFARSDCLYSAGFAAEYCDYNFVGAGRGVNSPERTHENVDRLVAAGKHPKVALTACIRKIITTLNSMIHNNQPWDPQRMLPASA